MANFQRVSRQYVRALTTAHRVATKHSGKMGDLADRVSQDKKRIQLHAKRTIVVDPTILASFSEKAIASQAKLQRMLKTKTLVPSRTITPAIQELTKHVDALIKSATMDVNDPGRGNPKRRKGK